MTRGIVAGLHHPSASRPSGPQSALVWRRISGHLQRSSAELGPTGPRETSGPRWRSWLSPARGQHQNAGSPHLRGGSGCCPVLCAAARLPTCLPPPLLHSCCAVGWLPPVKTSLMTPAGAEWRRRRYTISEYVGALVVDCSVCSALSAGPRPTGWDGAWRVRQDSERRANRASTSSRQVPSTT